MSGLSAVQEARARREASAAQNLTREGVARPVPLTTVKAGTTANADFLVSVLPDQGHYCLFLLPEARHAWTDSVDGLVRLVEKHKDRQGVYYATESFKDQSGRSQANVLALKALRLDLDAGEKKYTRDPAGTYATQQQAREDLARFTAECRLTPSYVISSGEGLHVYYVLHESCKPSDWHPIARSLAELAKQHSLRVDSTVTCDSARILRPIGTLHQNGKRVEVLEATGKIYTLAEIAAGVKSADEPAENLHGPTRVYARSINDDVLTPHADAPVDAELIAKDCEAYRWAVDPANQPKVPEPYWRGVLGIVKHCIGANQLAQEVSKCHPDYDPNDTARKLDAWGAGPTTCTEFGRHSSACSVCEHQGKIKSPVMLGRVTQQPNHDTPVGALAVAIESGALHPIVDQDGVLNYVETYEKHGRKCRQVVRSGTGAASDLILTTAALSGGKAPSQQAVATFEAQLRMRAKRAGAVTPVALRVANDGETCFIDLGPGRIVRVTVDGWEQIDESEGVPLFRRGAGAGELPDPIPFHGDPRAAFAYCLQHYRELYQTPVDQAAVRIAVALDRLDSETTHPVCEYVGPAGSGKSTAVEHDVGLIDPPSKKGLRTCGFKTEDIAAVAQQQYVLVMDNVSRFDKATADTLCISATGGTLTVRKLYEQAETAALHLLRPVAVTAVSPVCTQPDLQTRTLRFEFTQPQNGDVLGEHEIRSKTAARLPALLGALYSLKAATLRALPEVRQRKGWKHRLVTFDQTGEAMLTAVGYQPGAFIKIVGKLRESMARRSASGDVFLLKVCGALKVVQSWPKDEAEPPTGQVMKRPRAAAVFGTADAITAVMRPGVLLELLPRPDPWDRDTPMPRTERALMDALRRVQPTLHTMGVLYRESLYGTRQVLRFDWRVSDLDDLEGAK